MSVKIKNYTSTTNACKLCNPLGASLVIAGLNKAMTLLHGSQGCSTYIRRYCIGHFREPMDIASSSFSEDTAIFGGKKNLINALENIRIQYEPEIIGIATTCLSETIGDDVPMFIKEYKAQYKNIDTPEIMHISTPSYKGSHIDGFHKAVLSTVKTFAIDNTPTNKINIMPGMISPADIRYLKEIIEDFGLEYTLLPDYSDSLDGGSWNKYHKIPDGGTKLEDIRKMPGSIASIEFGSTLNMTETAGKWLEKEFKVKCYSIDTPIGITASDKFFNILNEISNKNIPEKYKKEKARLIDSYIDGHKFNFEKKAVIYGEEDLVAGMASFLSETGVIPVVCASGGKSGLLKKIINGIFPDYMEKNINIFDGADFKDISEASKKTEAELIIGHSKGYKLSREMDIPLIRVGFPVHDRIGGQRILHIGYRGTQELFDKITNSFIEVKQASSPVGYMAM